MKGMWIVLVSFLMLLSAGTSGVCAVSARFVGVRKCRICHLKEYKSWAETPMSRAFDLLKPGVDSAAKVAVGLRGEKDYTEDPACLRCHVTGGRTDLPGVQCEACHGPGSGYIKVMIMNRHYLRKELSEKGLRDAGKPDCVRCHNSKSPFYKGFNYEQYARRELHFQVFSVPGVHKKFPLKFQHTSSGKE